MPDRVMRKGYTGSAEVPQGRGWVCGGDHADEKGMLTKVKDEILI